MSRISGLILFWLAFCGSAVRTSSAEIKSLKAESTHRVTRWTAENGLPQNTIKALAQTPDGYLWVGTLYGLARFDGIRFKIFDQSNTPEMTHDSINALAVDQQDGSLWVSTGRDLLHYKDYSFEKCAGSLPVGGSVGILHAAKGGGVWLSPQNGQVGLFRGGGLQKWNITSAVSAWPVEEILQPDEDHLIIRLNHELYKLDLATQTSRNLRIPGIEQFGCQACTVQGNGSIWVCADNGLWLLQAENWRHLLDDQGGAWSSAARIFSIGDGGTYLTLSRAFGAGLFRFDSETEKLIRASELPTLEISGVLRDLEGNLWVGSDEGLFRLEQKRVEVYADGLASENARGLTVGSDDAIWVTTARGMSVIRAGQIKNIPLREPVPDWNSLSVLMVDEQNRVWVPYQYNTFRIVINDEWEPFYPFPEDHPYVENYGIHSIYEDGQKQVWIGTSRGVLFQKNGRWKTCLMNTVSNSCDVRVIHQDRNGDMWFGTYGTGLYRLQDDVITPFKTDRGELNNRAWCIHEDANGVFWIGSQNGLNRFVPPGRGKPDGTFFTFTAENGLRENVINNIQEDDSGYLWLSGLRGIYQIARRDLNEVALGLKKQAHCISYGEADGMLSGECNGGDNQPAGCKDQKGRIWFPTLKGVVMIDPKRIQKNEIPPPVIIEQVIADKRIVFGDGFDGEMRKRTPTVFNQNLITTSSSTSGSAAMIFKAGTARVLEFHYTANSLTAPERVLFKYRLEGYENDWQRDDENRRVAFYTNLRPGQYRFCVRACNNHGYWNETGAVFAFSIAPKFSQTVWFPASCAAGLLGISGGLAAWRLRWQRRLLKMEQQRVLANERTRIARDLHDDLGTALTGLALELDIIRRETVLTPKVPERLGETASRTRDLAERMREVVWAVNPRCDTVSSLASFLEQQTAQFLKSDGIRGRLEFPENIPAWPVAADVRHQLALGVREALTNVVRHAQATEVTVSLAVEARTIVVRIADNGCGFDEEKHPNGRDCGHGLSNLRERLERIRGSFECCSTPGLGTTATFRVPFEPMSKSTGSNGEKTA